jgi:hypothetical protein
MRLRAARVGSVVVGFSLVMAACGPGADAPEPIPKSDGQPSHEDFVRAVPTFPYVASSERQNRIRAGYVQLEIGATKEQVLTALGQPDYSQLRFTKGPKPRWLGSSWTYWFAKRSDGANTFDPVVQIFFDTNDRAEWMGPCNIDGLPEKGPLSMSGCRSTETAGFDPYG